VLVAEDGSVELRFGGILEAFYLFFGFRGEIGLEGIQIFLDASTMPTDLPFLPFEFFSSGMV